MLATKIKSGACIALVILGLLACGAPLDESSRSSSATPFNTPVMSTTPTSANFPPTSPLSTIEQMVSDQAYRSGCGDLATPVFSEQVGFGGVFPGVSTYADVTNLLGEPNEKGYGGTQRTQWRYDGVSVLFDDGKGVVEVIEVFRGEAFDRMALPLRDLIEKYGCPEIIYAYDEGEEKSGHFSATSFAYPNLGIEYDFRGTPVSLDSRPEDIDLYASEAISDYLLDRKQTLQDPEATVVLRWDEAVVK